MATVAYADNNLDSYFHGQATSYTLGQVSSGDCNFMYDPGVGDNYAALNSDQSESTLNCGRCAEVSCDDSQCSGDATRSALVYIVDKCPGCAHGALGLSPTVFGQLRGNSDPSEYTIKWNFVDCPVTGNIQYCTKSGSSNSWLAVQPANLVSGIASVKIANQAVKTVDSSYYFLLSSGANIDMSAVEIEVTSVSGEKITEKLALTADACTGGTSNFEASATQNSMSRNVSSPSSPMNYRTPTTDPISSLAPSAAGSGVVSQQAEVNNYFGRLNQNGSTGGAGKVIAANESSREVSILQSSEGRVEKTPATQSHQPDTGNDTKEITTKSSDFSPHTSPVLVSFVVLAVVGGVASAVVAYTVKKKVLDDKREGFNRSFDTLSSPVNIDMTIAKI
uniref:Expansin-like EG45 domain-containing protein n=2 Tax=Hyaloperonospora arabidopsidis (strain Emoy2) TaxID=559515 RepID=M4BG13_HYAAE